jgi:DNA-binding NtrC family response regulator
MEFQRVGGNETIQTSVRVIAATNRNLEQAIADREFREDLYHRLNVVTINVPPLRERRGEIAALVDFFVRRYSHELNIRSPVIAGEAMALLNNYPWPGNVRQLQHCIHRTMIFSGGHPIRADSLQLDVEPTENKTQSAFSTASLIPLIQQFLTHYQGEQAHTHFLEATERLLLEEALLRTDGNQSQAARLLGLARPTLHAKMQKLGL